MGNKIFFDAPLVIVISMEEEKGMDVGILVQSLALAAKGMGLDSVILGFPRVSFDSVFDKKWNEKLCFPENYVYGISIAIGYGDEEGRSRQVDPSKVSYLR